jgi:hypothetical protein
MMTTFPVSYWHPLLKKQGHEVVAVDDDLRALEAFHNGYFPILILDWLMPGMDGLDLCRQVRRLQREHYTYICPTHLTQREVQLPRSNELAQPPQPRGPTLLNGVRPDFRHDKVEEIEHVILGARSSARMNASKVSFPVRVKGTID